MATYKVIQDIEAEDKLLGPLSLRQFIYAVIVVVMGFISFKLGIARWYLALPFLPPMILFGILAAPFGHDQPSEVWLLAKIRFNLKPRVRIWDQSGAKQLVTVTAPKRPEKHYTDGLSQTEVKSRLRALAETIDSRGWAVKNVNVNLYTQPSYAVANAAASDRLVEASSLPQEVPAIDITASDDIMDPHNNPRAQQLDEMMAASARAHREQAVQRMQETSNPATAGAPSTDYWFLNQPDPSQLPGPGYATFGSQTVTPGAATAAAGGANDTPLAPDEAALLEQLHQREQLLHGSAEIENYGHMKVINPLGQAPAAPAPPPQPDPGPPEISLPAPVAQPAPPVTRAPEPAILELANNDDLNVATLAREADRAARKQPPADEVVVQLH